jgi:hypothetical protein
MLGIEVQISQYYVHKGRLGVPVPEDLLQLRPEMASSPVRHPVHLPGSLQLGSPASVILVAVYGGLLLTRRDDSYNGAAEPRQAAKESALNVLIKHCGERTLCKSR